MSTPPHIHDAPAIPHADGERPAPRFDVDKVRAYFPLLASTVRGKPLVYLDNAATTQKPACVIEALEEYYRRQNANIHRGVYQLSETATDAYELARRKVQKFINAGDPAEIIFTRGTTEGINLVAATWARTNLRPGDEILISAMEHHSNIVPWQMVCQATGAVLRVILMNDAGELLMEQFARLLSPMTRLVAVNHVSNALGTVNPVAEIIGMAHHVGAKVLIDGAQAVAHRVTDVQGLDADFYAFSGHKLYGPTGIGVLYGKRTVLEAMPPYQGGGDMIRTVTFEKTVYAELPNKFEAGTPHISGAIGLGAAIDYLTGIGIERAAAHEESLLGYGTERLMEVPGLRMVGTAKHKAGVLSFVMEDPAVSSLDIGVKLDQKGVAIRTGHHCCQPVMDRFAIASTARASLAMYTTRGEIDALVEGLKAIAQETAGRRASLPGVSVAGVAQSPAVVSYPAAFAASPMQAADQLAEEFEFLADRDTKNDYVLDLGRQLPALFDMLKQVTPRVQGCMSEVYLVGRATPDRPDCLEFVADANADIVRGLIAVLQRLYSGQPAKEVLAFDIEAFFRRIELDQFITSQRRNGLQGMVGRIRELARGIQAAKMRP